MRANLSYSRENEVESVLPLCLLYHIQKKESSPAKKFLQDFLFFKREKLVKSNPASTVIGITFMPITACEGEPSDPEFPIRKAKII